MKFWEKYSNICPKKCNVTQFILSGNCSTCFGWYHHPSSGAWKSWNSSTIAAGSSNGVTNTRCCRYCCLRSWWWVELPSETGRAVSKWNKMCKVASCWIYIRIFLRCTDPWTSNSERKSYPSATLPTTDVTWTARFPFREVKMGFISG